ncbi:hypothetical protein FAVG1_08356 [Fusarium avenaceum]|nr:hypothetical protein FAVG1_08356 [Fusarium avenaceum]
MNLTDLPREVLAEIFSLEFPTLPRKDILSARLTCRELAQVLTPVLFHTISISPLIQDRDDFFNITKRPHLACLVRCIVWEELNGNLNALDPTSWYNTIPASEHPFFEDLTTNAKSLFWLDPLVSTDEDEDPTIHISQDLQDIRLAFQNVVLTNMPNLSTFVSRPMNSRRQLEMPSMGYKISVATITEFIQKYEARDSWNFGFRFFLIPTLKRLAQGPPLGPLTPTITQLLYADEGINDTTALLHLTNADAVAFSTLQTVDLCIPSRNSGVIDTPLAGFLTCLEKAKGLTTLKICQEIGCTAYYDTPPFYLVAVLPTLSALTELHFTDIDVDEDESHPASMESEFREVRMEDIILDRPRHDSVPGMSDILAGVELNEAPQLPAHVEFIGRHSKTLKRVYITCSGIRKQVIKQLASLNSLQLERLVVTSGDDIEEFGEYEMQRQMHVSERALLDYVNRVDSSGKRPTLPYGKEQRDTELHTHDAIFDNDACMSAAVFDTRSRGWEQRGYAASDVRVLDAMALERRDEYGIAHYIGARRTHDADTGLWVDVDGIHYNPITDQEIDNPVGLYQSKDNSWTIQGQRSWDTELGLWRDKETSKLSRFAVDKESWREQINYNVDSDTTDWDMRPFYDEEDEYHWLRVEEAPHWDWGRDQDNRVWYWQITSAVSGHATEMWYFRHKDEHAYGHDPLEFWEDWYCNAEDRAEATPFGWGLACFTLRPDTGGSEIPQQDSCKGLTMYERSDDPMFLEGDWWKYIPDPPDLDIHSRQDWYNVFESAVETVRASFPGAPYYQI